VNGYCQRCRRSAVDGRVPANPGGSHVREDLDYQFLSSESLVAESAAEAERAETGKGFGGGSIVRPAMKPIRALAFFGATSSPRSSKFAVLTFGDFEADVAPTLELSKTGSDWRGTYSLPNDRDGPLATFVLPARNVWQPPPIDTSTSPIINSGHRMSCMSR
jgi:hypothetical protein